MSTLDTPCDYLVEAQRRAATTSEAEHRAKAFEAELAEIGERGFFNVVQMRTSTERLLLQAQSEARALYQRELLSQAGFEEELLAECKRLCGGDVLKAQLLASWAKEI